MELNEDMLLSGDIILLWRVHFNNFTNETIIPQYFEYRYGIDAVSHIDILINKGLIIIDNATNTLELLTIKQLKEILKYHNLSIKGNKASLIDYIKDNLKEEELQNLFDLRKYQITSQGSLILNKYPEVLKHHGTKKSAK